MALTTKAQVISKARAYFMRHVADAVSGADGHWWPQRIALAWPGLDEATRLFADGRLDSWRSDILSLACSDGIEVEVGERRVSRVMIRVPLSVTVDDAKAAARLSHELQGYEGLCARAQVVLDSFPDVEPSVLRKIIVDSREWGDEDFRLFLTVAVHASEHDYVGCTPHMLGIPGVGTHWFDSKGHTGLVELLVGHELGLASRQWTVQLKYLDPNHLASGGRAFDSCMPGDRPALAYDPSTVVIVENYDTWYSMPALDGAVCLFGSGRAGIATIPTFDWVRSARNVVYWGDIDADGLEILDGYRSRGLPVRSVLMDCSTWSRFEPFGNDYTAGRAPLSKHRRLGLSALTESEQELYDLLTSPSCPGHRRVEQELIPYDEFFAALP